MSATQSTSTTEAAQRAALFFASFGAGRNHPTAASASDGLSKAEVPADRDTLCSDVSSDARSSDSYESVTFVTSRRTSPYVAAVSGYTLAPPIPAPPTEFVRPGLFLTNGTLQEGRCEGVDVQLSATEHPDDGALIMGHGLNLQQALPPHDHIVSLHRWWWNDAQPSRNAYLWQSVAFTTSRYTLSDIVPLGNLGPAVQRTIATQLGKALAFVRGQQLVHLGVRPSAVHVTRSASGDPSTCHIQLGRFEHARRLNEEGTATGSYIAEKHYAAPECFREVSVVSGATDVFSLGCIAYYMATGEAPGAEHARDMLRFLADRRTADSVVVPARLRGWSPEGLVTLREFVAGCTARDPAARLRLA